MTYQNISKNGVETAQPLEFAARNARQELTITIHATIDGFPTEICFSGALDQLEAITRRLRDLGASPAGVHQLAPAAPVQSGANTPARKAAAAVTYADDGTPLCANANCSRHGHPLEPSQHNGYYCKGKDARTGNNKGYCKSTAN
jgi:hypothetical protein